MSTIELINFITGICSIVLSIVSFTLSILFYRWSDKNNKEITKLTSDIRSQTDTLAALFDKMFNTSFRMIESQSTAMQNKLFDTKGEVENKDATNYEFETVIYLNKIKKCNINDIVNHLKIEEAKVKTIVKKIKDRGAICINGEEISIIESNSYSIEQSDTE